MMLYGFYGSLRCSLVFGRFLFFSCKKPTILVRLWPSMTRHLLSTTVKNKTTHENIGFSNTKSRCNMLHKKLKKGDFKINLMCKKQQALFRIQIRTR